MEDKLKVLKEKVSILAQNKDFAHHKWYLQYHLDLVEKLSLEFCEMYPEVNLDLLLGLVWIHDYGKIVSIKDEKDVIEESRIFMLSVGFEQEYVNDVIGLLEIFESKMTDDLSEAPMEVRIVSTADAVSHMYGPFFQMYCYEHPEMSVEDLMASNLKKLEKDWNRKIVLPGVKELLQERYLFLRESFGDIPNRMLDLNAEGNNIN